MSYGACAAPSDKQRAVLATKCARNIPETIPFFEKPRFSPVFCIKTAYFWSFLQTRRFEAALRNQWFRRCECPLAVVVFSKSATDSKNPPPSV